MELKTTDQQILKYFFLKLIHALWKTGKEWNLFTEMNKTEQRLLVLLNKH